MMDTSKRLEGIGEYYFSQKLREIEGLNKQGKNVINLGIGSPDLPPHPDVIRILQEESAKPNVHAYQGYKGSPVLRKAMADWYQRWYNVSLDPDTEILPLIGSKEGIMHVCLTFLNEGDLVMVPNPGYPTYRSAAKLAGGRIVEYSLREENDWYPDFDELQNIIDAHPQAKERGSLMWVNYPQMPTGQLPDQILFERLIQFGLKNNVLICHDNPYSFILNDNPMSILSVPGAKETALELNSLSKSQNMAGWRVGLLASGKEIVDAVMRFKSNMDSGMFLPIQLAAAKALGLGRDWYDQVNEVYRNRRKIVFELLDLLDTDYSEEQAGMFVWARIPSAYKNGYELSDEILNTAAVFITPGGIFGAAGDPYIRISLCSPEEKFREAIARIQQSKKISAPLEQALNK